MRHNKSIVSSNLNLINSVCYLGNVNVWLSMFGTQCPTIRKSSHVIRGFFFFFLFFFLPVATNKKSNLHKQRLVLIGKFKCNLTLSFGVMEVLMLY
jgi:hypothetical protein